MSSGWIRRQRWIRTPLSFGRRCAGTRTSIRDPRGFAMSWSAAAMVARQEGALAGGQELRPANVPCEWEAPARRDRRVGWSRVRSAVAEPATRPWSAKCRVQRRRFVVTMRCWRAAIALSSASRSATEIRARCVLRRSLSGSGLHTRNAPRKSPISARPNEPNHARNRERTQAQRSASARTANAAAAKPRKNASAAHPPLTEGRAADPRSTATPAIIGPSMPSSRPPHPRRAASLRGHRRLAARRRPDRARRARARSSPPGRPLRTSPPLTRS